MARTPPFRSDSPGETPATTSGPTGGVSRRAILKRGVTAGIAGYAAPGAFGNVASAEPAAIGGPRQESTVGTPFRAFVRYRDGVAVEELTLLPIQPREVVIRTEASMACYSITPFALGTSNYQTPTIMNHSGMGTVVEVGPQVQRVQPGDRVVVAGTPQCGQCYQCLQGRSDHCMFLSGADVHPIARMADGTGVVAMSALGGISEIMVVTEEYCCPVFTDLPAAQLAMLADTSGTGIAAGMNLTQVHPGADVVVMGLGPLGLAAVQSARIMGAAQIIGVDPIPYRREIAEAVGATLTLDPNAEANLVARVQELTAKQTDRLFAGGTGPRGRGADYVFEAVGGDQFPPIEPAGPDPTGILPLRQGWDMACRGGHIVTHGIGQRGEVSFPASAFCISGKTFHAGQQGGMNMMADLPRFVRLVETGQFDAETILGRTYTLDEARDAFQDAADRTVISAVVTFG
jgi:S-(hydroxymethyl)glutathione dehydrogenase/alcohol dehydrogenase